MNMLELFTRTGSVLDPKIAMLLCVITVMQHV